MKRLIPAALLLASCGQGSAAPDIKVADAWARETVPGQSSTAAYMTIANTGTAGNRLVSVTASAPLSAMVHNTSSENGVSRMRPADSGVDVPAGSTVRLEPGGTHVMIMGIQSALKPGDTLKLRLRFEKSGERAVAVPVRSAI